MLRIIMRTREFIKNEQIKPLHPIKTFQKQHLQSSLSLLILNNNHFSMLTHDMLECKEEENIIRQIEYQTNVMNHRDNKYKNNANKVDNIYQLLDTIIECNKT